MESLATGSEEMQLRRRAFAHGAMGRQIDPSLSYFSIRPECLTTGVIKAVVYVILSMGSCI